MKTDFDDLKDFEDEGDFKTRRTPGDSILTTRRILLTAALITVVALVIGRWLFLEPVGSKTVPPELIGVWMSDNPEYSDRYLELKPQAIVFGTGGTSYVHYKILRVAPEKVAETDVYRVRFRDVGGGRHSKDIVLDAQAGELFFLNQRDVVWKRFER